MQLVSGSEFTRTFPEVCRTFINIHERTSIPTAIRTLWVAYFNTHACRDAGI